MTDLVKWGKELEDALHLTTKIVAYRKVERTEDLEEIEDVRRVDRPLTFC